MNNECFVIQPISDTRFIKRFDDIFKPSIEKAGLNAYRVDLDPSVKIPIEDIESNIKNSVICFADISIDNPNVWYELGYAFALGKDVVMVCDENRKDFPFDVRHKNIIRYKTESSSDFEELKNSITEKIKAYLQIQHKTIKILENPMKDTEGLQSFELALLAFIIGEQYTDEEVVNVSTLKNRMNNAGYTDTAFSIGMRLLKSKSYINTEIIKDPDGYQYSVCFLTIQGESFILSNTSLFDLEQQGFKGTQQVAIGVNELDLPF